MTLIIDVAPEVEQALENEATQAHQSVADVAEAWLADVARTRHAERGARQADIAARLALLAEWQKEIEARPVRDPEAPPFQDEVDLGISRADFYGYTERERV